MSDQSGFRLDWSRSPWSELLSDCGEDLTLHVDLWHPPFDPFKPGAPWWQWREPCDCPDTTFGRKPHRWNCALTPIWAQTIRDLDTNPWTVLRDAMEWCTLPVDCAICGDIGAHRAIAGGDSEPILRICSECWQLNRHAMPEQWHCAECGVFLRGLDRCVLWTASGGVYLCAGHLADRIAEPNPVVPLLRGFALDYLAVDEPYEGGSN